MRLSFIFPLKCIIALSALCYTAQISQADTIQGVTVYNASNLLETNVKNLGKYNDGVMLAVFNGSVRDLIWTNGITQILIFRGTTADVGSERGIQVGNKFFFTATSDTYGTELYVTDGTALGTVLVKDLVFGADSSEPKEFIVLGNFACFKFYNGFDFVFGCSDGTPSGTNSLFRLTTYSYSTASSAILGNKLIMMGSDPTKGDEPFITDGTLVGTSLLNDLSLGNSHYNSNWYNFTVINNRVYFNYLIGNAKSEIWSTDGTPGGTIRVLTSPQIFDLKYITALISFEGKLIIPGHTPDLDDGRILVTDGSVNGSVSELYRAGVTPAKKWLKGVREVSDKVRIPLEFSDYSLIGVVECSSVACTLDENATFAEGVDRGVKLGNFWYLDLESLDIGFEFAQVQASPPHPFNFISDIVYGNNDPQYDFANASIINNQIFVTGEDHHDGTALFILTQGPDNCLSDVFKHNPGLCGCGIPENDSDIDGDLVPDCIDSCVFGQGSGCPLATPTPQPTPTPSNGSDFSLLPAPWVKVSKGKVSTFPGYWDQDGVYYFSVTIQIPKKKAKTKFFHATRKNLASIAKNLPKGTLVSIRYYYVLPVSTPVYTSPWSKIKKIKIK